MSALENLIEAVKQGDRESVRAVLESDARLANQKDASGATPLHYAALNGHRQIVQLLLERGADINSTDSQFAPRQLVGQLNICARWVDTWRSSLMTLPTPFGSGTPSGLRDS